MWKPCAVIPVYNHGATLAGVLAPLAAAGLPIFIVDDGSDAANKALVAAAAASCPHSAVITRPENGGKGAAVMDGLFAAEAAGFSHAFQVDADGQHDTEAVPRFLKEAKRRPDTCVCGLPQFDASVPASRLKGRRISNRWAAIVTHSDALKDVLCGFRVYPLAAACGLLRKSRFGKHMDFDPQILVRLYRAGTPVAFLPVKVRYPEDGLSHFHLVRDNIRISLMWAGLFLSQWRKT
jgi:glycosyltransferase involved in cell wall biosynthesis